MSKISRRDIVLSAATAAAAFGLSGPLSFVGLANAQRGSGAGEAPAKLFHRFKVGNATVTQLYDGIWEKPHDPAFIKNASVDDTKKALVAGGYKDDFVPISFTVTHINVGGKSILIDSGTGNQAGGPKALGIAKALEAAGIKSDKIDIIAISHFHPDHIFGLMTKDKNEAVFPKAQLVMSDAEYKFWTDPALIPKLPEARQGLAKRIQAVFPQWKSRITLVGDNARVSAGVRSIATPGHTPGHTSYIVSSGKKQLIVLGDVANVPALFLKNPGWHAVFDHDGGQAEATRRKMFDRVVADKAIVSGYHFPFPGAGTLAKDGSGYAFTPVKA